MKRKKWIIIVLIFVLVVILAIISYSVYIEKNLNSSCRRIGEAESNASMGPDGFFGTCCKGLIPMTHREDMGMAGNASYCEPIIPLPWLKK